jgi:DNA-binding GntR family transcriptional regulator
MTTNDPEILPAELLQNPAIGLDAYRNSSLTSVLATEIERLILSGEISPGRSVRESQLATRFSVSRSPIREALRQLEQAGIVESHTNRGFFVRAMDLGQATEIFQARAGLFGMAAYRLAPVVGVAALSSLDHLTTQMDEATSDRGEQGYDDLNLAFHRKIFSLSGAERISQIYFGLVKELQLLRRRALVEPQARQQSNAEHKAIVLALRSGDPDQAMAAARQHILASLERTRRREGG